MNRAGTEPMTLEDIAGQEHFKRDARMWRKNNDYPAAILLHGKPGIGKTSVSKVLARTVLGEFFDEANFIITNASDDRGIDFVRHTLRHWASVKGIGVTRKVIVLDEADGLTTAAQDALRQIIELSSDNVLWILTANQISKIRPAIKSRCTVYQFKPIKPTEALERLMALRNKWGLNGHSEDDWETVATNLIKLHDGDMRSAMWDWAMAESPEALLERKRQSKEGAVASLAAIGSEWMDLRLSLHRMLDNGQTLTQTISSFQRNLTSFFEMDEDRTFAIMAVLGDMLPHMYEWTLDSYSFVDCLVAKIRREVDTHE